MKLYLLLALTISTYASASEQLRLNNQNLRINTQGLGHAGSYIGLENTRTPSPVIDEIIKCTSPQALYYMAQINQARRIVSPRPKGSLQQPKKISAEIHRAYDQYLLANECLIRKMPKAAVKILNASAPLIDASKILLAYCYKYGIGVEINPAASRILADLVCKDREDRKELELHFQYLLKTVQLGI